MTAWERFGVALFYTIGLMVGSLMYAEVFRGTLLPLVNPDGTFSQPVMILNRIVPIVLLVILGAVWIWTIAGAVQDESRVQRRTFRR